MKVIGYREASFTADSGEVIEGYNLYVARNIDKKYGEGVSCERIFITKGKMAKCEYNLPCVGTEVEVMYNRYGKIADIRLA